MKKTIQSLEELAILAQEIASKLQFNIVLFEGNLGAGKTTLIKLLAKALGSQDTVSSPTFSIVNEYEIPNGKIFHFDLYRIASEEEALGFGVEEYLDSGDYCFIEWPDTIHNLLPEDFHRIEINATAEKRTIIFT